MSGVKHFHRKEAAKILIELRSKTEDERLMDYRRQLLNKDSNMDEFRNSSDFQDRLENSCWPWVYPNLAVPPYNLNTVPIGYPTWTPNPQFWFSSSPSYIPETATSPFNLHPPSFPGLDYQASLPWPMPLSYHQAYVDPRHCSRRRRTKFTNEQLAVLEKTFTEGSKFPSPVERMELESLTGLSKDKISVWFQNRRAKEKREKGQELGIKEETSTTTTDSELDTEDERQQSIYDETPEEGSEIEDTRNDESNTSGNINDPEPEEKIAVHPSGLYPGESPEEKIAVHSTEPYRGENPEERIVVHPSGPNHSEYPEETIAVHYGEIHPSGKPGKTIAVHPSGPYRSENPKETIAVHHGESYRSENLETIVVHPSGPYRSENQKDTMIVHQGGLYHCENEITVSLLPSTHLTASCYDEQPRKRGISKTTSIDERPHLSAKGVSSNDVLKNVQQDIHTVDDSDRIEDDSGDDFTFQNKKIKTEEEDILSTNTVATQTNIFNEYRMFGET